jgi:hypothetical protein
MLCWSVNWELDAEHLLRTLPEGLLVLWILGKGIDATQLALIVVTTIFEVLGFLINSV